MSGFEVRVTPWRNVRNDPAWMKSKVQGYRIFICQYGALWFQRHEWEYPNDEIRRDEWIKSTSNFPPHAQPIEYSLSTFLNEMSGT